MGSCASRDNDVVQAAYHPSGSGGAAKHAAAPATSTVARADYGTTSLGEAVARGIFAFDGSGDEAEDPVPAAAGGGDVATAAIRSLFVAGSGSSDGSWEESSVTAAPAAAGSLLALGAPVTQGSWRVLRQTPPPQRRRGGGVLPPLRSVKPMPRGSTADQEGGAAAAASRPFKRTSSLGSSAFRGGRSSTR
jgi:hypothetical protein